MPVAATSVPREARWFHNRLRSLTPPLTPYRDVGKGTGRHIVYKRQGGTDASNLSGVIVVRSAWLVYVSQPVVAGMQTASLAEDMEADADRMHEAIHKPPITSVNGRDIHECRRDMEHYLPVYDGLTLTEVQLGGVYLTFTTLS